ncbi:hypothetical protein [Candidatus Arsenophonus triatominarum]|uniref:hypothetical protein n=1 Tax=Candidatus Arsenophonus triatominarum TaxID=57911 RepID=UPI000A871A29|nr:hypothetical protein [Candidatus Arsenophonus triatominarum]
MKLIHFLTVIITVMIVFCTPFNLLATPITFDEAKKLPVMKFTLIKLAEIKERSIVDANGNGWVKVVVG